MYNQLFKHVHNINDDLVCVEMTRGDVVLNKHIYRRGSIRIW